MNWQSPPAMRKTLLIAVGMLLSAGATLAQQSVQPLPKVGGCPLGYYSSGGYCVPSSSCNTLGAIKKSSNGCPLCFYTSGHYCLSSLSNDRGAIQNTGKSCPLGWFFSGDYCGKSRQAMNISYLCTQEQTTCQWFSSIKNGWRSH